MRKWITGLAAVMLFSVFGVTVCAAEGSASLTFDTFRTALVEAVKERAEYVDSLTEENVTMQTAAEAAKQEWEKLSLYDTVAFGQYGETVNEVIPEEEVSNEEYLRREYMDGLKLQYESGNEIDEQIALEKWTAGYLKRASVLEELIRVYKEWGIPERVITGIEEHIQSFCGNRTNEAYQMQALLNGLLQETGESVGIDGQPGQNTVFALKRQQVRLGLSINGVVNAERVAELVDKLISEGKQSVIETANNQLAQVTLDDGSAVAQIKIQQTGDAGIIENTDIIETTETVANIEVIENTETTENELGNTLPVYGEGQAADGEAGFGITETTAGDIVKEPLNEGL